MSDAERLYQMVEQNVRTLLPEMLEENRETLCQIITEILRGRSGQLLKIASKVKYGYKNSSLVERFRRFVKNPNIIVDAGYNPLATWFLNSLTHTRLVFAIDSTKVGGNCICLMLSSSTKVELCHSHGWFLKDARVTVHKRYNKNYSRVLKLTCQKAVLSSC